MRRIGISAVAVLALLAAVAPPAGANPRPTAGMAFWCEHYDVQYRVLGGDDTDTTALVIQGLDESKGSVPKKWGRKIAKARTDAAQLAAHHAFARDCEKRGFL